MVNFPNIIYQKKISEVILIGIFFIISFLLSYTYSTEKVLLIIFTILIVYLIFKIPELGFTLFLLIGVLKNITEKLPFDFTVIIFVLTFLSLIIHLSQGKMTCNITNKYFLLIIGFACLIIIGYFFSKAPQAGLLKVTRFVTFNIFLFIGGLSIGLSYKHAERFIKVIFIVLFIYGLIYLYFLKDVIGMNMREIADYHLRFTLVGNPIGVGRIFSVLVLISMIYYFKNNKYKPLYLISFLMGLIITFATNSRGPLVALIFSILVYLLVFSGIKRIKILVILIALMVVFSGVFLLLPKNFVNRYSFGLTKEINISEDQIKVFSTSQEREKYFKQSITYLNENPEKIIFGIGTGSFSYLSKYMDVRLYPHNIFIEIILEFGIIGLLLFILPFIFLIKEFVHYRKNIIERKIYPLFVLWIILTILFLINAQFSGDINDNRLLWFFQGGSIGLFLSLREKIHSPEI